jgi:NADP-dependent 3-hydroxy acid dehydrogenase YdfG
MTDFTGRAALVTGASSGIGRAIAVELASAGIEVWLVGQSAEDLAGTAALIAEAGGPKARCEPMDLRQRGPISALIERIGAEHPHLFVTVNNAGVMYPEPILSGTVERWQAMFDVNVLALLEGSKAAVEVMRRHGKPGFIINVGSLQSRLEIPGVYGASKQAVEAIGVSLRQELENDDIRVTTILPGGFVTKLSRGFAPEQLAALATGFEALGIDLAGPEAERLLGDPRHIARLVRYVIEQPIGINLHEVVIRPPVSIKV